MLNKGGKILSQTRIMNMFKKIADFIPLVASTFVSIISLEPIWNERVIKYKTIDVDTSINAAFGRTWERLSNTIKTAQ